MTCQVLPLLSLCCCFPLRNPSLSFPMLPKHWLLLTPHTGSTEPPHTLTPPPSHLHRWPPPIWSHFRCQLLETPLSSLTIILYSPRFPRPPQPVLTNLKLSSLSSFATCLPGFNTTQKHHQSWSPVSSATRSPAPRTVPGTL